MKRTLCILSLCLSFTACAEDDDDDDDGADSGDSDPTANPTANPTADPTEDPTADPTVDPTADPTVDPTADPTVDPTADPTFDTGDPTEDPTDEPPDVGCDNVVTPCPPDHGATCSNPGAAASDCQSGICDGNGSFIEGKCTVACNSNEDCPFQSSCVEHDIDGSGSMVNVCAV